MKDILKELCERLDNEIAVVLVTVIRKEGSTPRGPGSKMLVDSTGLICGSIGGGLAEAEALKSAELALKSKNTDIIDFMLTGEMAAQCEMICGGHLQILVEPIFPTAQSKEFFRKLLDSLDLHTPFVLTVLSETKSAGRSLRLDDTWDLNDNLPDNVLSSEQKNELIAQLAKGQEIIHIKTPEGQDYIVECYPPIWQMIIAGGGHVSLFTAQVAALAGFSVIVFDDREEFSKPERFPQASATYTIPEFENCFQECPPTKHTCLVIVTRGHLHDKTVLEQALPTKASYIGMIGSKRKRKQVYDALLAQNATQEQIDAVYCPIGLNINAETPEEIAISIVGQCIAHRRGALDILKKID